MPAYFRQIKLKVAKILRNAKKSYNPASSKKGAILILKLTLML